MDNSPASLRIVTGNVRQDLPVNVALQDIEQAVASQRPDLICLQEATVEKVHDATTGYIGAIATAHNMEPVFAQTRHFHRKGGDIHSGIATLINDSERRHSTTTEIELNSQRYQTKLRPIGRRALLITSFEDEGTIPLHIVNAHLSYPTLNPLARRREWKKVFNIIDGLSGDVVISGDFNARPSSQFVRECNKRWKQISDQKLPTWEAVYGYMPNFIKKRAQRTIDYVFTNKNFSRNITTEQLPKMNSDHIWQAITIDSETFPVAAPKVRPQDSIASFTTSKGSVYTYDDAGHTTRFKTKTGTEQPKQDLTVFFDVGIGDAATIAKAYMLKSSVKSSRVEVVERQTDGTLKIIHDVLEIVDPNALQLVTFREDKVVKCKPASLFPKVGLYAFDTRRFKVDGKEKTERHIGHKVSSIVYR